jgi:hypothetical protein
VGITFLDPWAWLLSAAVALPIFIHLLARTAAAHAFPTCASRG